ncbi:MAG: prolipoprotein diacylglyceryl transferase [Marivirga sp.]|nr:prolipoprotein diacylglyceryl transferase [Marivirga sp.]
MHPTLFEAGAIPVYSYGFMIALGAIAGVAYMAIQGKNDVGLSFDQANTLFVFIFIAAFVGGKVFLFFEDIPFYTQHPGKLLTGRGFVFYGSFLFAIPTMLLFFRKHKLPTYAMLDVMAVTTCLVHVFGRIGCFLAGCCYGKPTDSVLAVSFGNAASQARPLMTPLHPSQLYEAGYIFLVMLILLFLRQRKKFYGQLFLVYLMLYAIGRFFLEYLRGDLDRGFVIDNYVSHSQFIAVLILIVVVFIYWKLSARNHVKLFKNPI